MGVEGSPFLMAVLMTLANWGFTALGAATVFLFREIDRRVFDGMLGFAAGIMLAACFWSLLAPAIALSPAPSWLPPLIGLAVGSGFMMLLDRTLPHLHLEAPSDQAEGIKTSWHRSVLMMLAITIHNFPEGLAVGVAFGAVAHAPAVTLWSALALGLGIGIQDIPEGAAIAFPLRREGFSAMRSFWNGQLSGIVEPLGGIIGFLAISMTQSLLPYTLGFAAGAMLFVVSEEVIPEAQAHGNSDLATFGLLVGFALMMVLDVALA